MSSTDHPYSYMVGWTLTVKLIDSSGRPAAGREISVLDRAGERAATGLTGKDGRWSVQLPQYGMDNGRRNDYSPYTVEVAGARELTLTAP